MCMAGLILRKPRERAMRPTAIRNSGKAIDCVIASISVARDVLRNENIQRRWAQWTNYQVSFTAEPASSRANIWHTWCLMYLQHLFTFTICLFFHSQSFNSAPDFYQDEFACKIYSFWELYFPIYKQRSKFASCHKKHSPKLNCTIIT